MQLTVGERNGQSPRELFFFGMVTHGPRGFDALEPLENPECYGVDWEAADDPLVQAHMAENDPFPETTPHQLSSVVVVPPFVEIEEALLAEFMARLGEMVDLMTCNMDVRRQVWIYGLVLAETMGVEGR
jgi:hypothetical protein